MQIDNEFSARVMSFAICASGACDKLDLQFQARIEDNLKTCADSENATPCPSKDERKKYEKQQDQARKHVSDFLKTRGDQNDIFTAREFFGLLQADHTDAENEPHGKCEPDIATLKSQMKTLLVHGRGDTWVIKLDHGRLIINQDLPLLIAALEKKKQP